MQQGLAWRQRGREKSPEMLEEAITKDENSVSAQNEDKTHGLEGQDRDSKGTRESRQKEVGQRIC